MKKLLKDKKLQAVREAALRDASVAWNVFNVGDVVRAEVLARRRPFLAVVCGRSRSKYVVVDRNGLRYDVGEYELDLVSSVRDADIRRTKKPLKAAGGQVPEWLQAGPKNLPRCHVGDVVKVRTNTGIHFGQVFSVGVPDQRGLCYTINISEYQWTLVRAREEDVVLVKKGWAATRSTDEE